MPRIKFARAPQRCTTGGKKVPYALLSRVADIVDAKAVSEAGETGEEGEETGDEEEETEEAGEETGEAGEAVDGETGQKVILKIKTKGIVKDPAAVRKKFKYRPGTVALREIRRQQKSTANLFPYAPVVRLAREIMQYMGKAEMRIERAAVDCLREACQQFITETNATAQVTAVHRKCITIEPKDMLLARVIQQRRSQEMRAFLHRDE
jgi:histone H3